MGLGMQDVIIMAISFLLVAILGPMAISAIATGYNTSTWNASVVTIFQVLLPIIWVIGVAIKYIPRGKGE
jgi:hypothetical protein